MAPHTPGPWVARHDAYGGEHWFGGDSEGGQWVIEGAWLVGGANDPSDEANARLIAAAPDLLAALEALVAEAGWRSDAVRAAHDVIAKARGQ